MLLLTKSVTRQQEFFLFNVKRIIREKPEHLLLQIFEQKKNRGDMDCTQSIGGNMGGNNGVCNEGQVGV